MTILLKLLMIDSKAHLETEANKISLPISSRSRLSGCLRILRWNLVNSRRVADCTRLCYQTNSLVLFEL